VVILLTLIFVGGGVCSESSKTQQYLNRLSSNNISAKIIAAKEITNSGIFDPVLFDEIEKQLLLNYTRKDLNPEEIDLLSWYCRDLSSSGLAKYRSTLEKVADKSSQIKISHNAQQNLFLLSTYTKHNKYLALEQQSTLPILDQQNSKFMAMLNSNNLKLKRNAAKIISRSLIVDQRVYDEIESQLLNHYQSIGGDKKMTDLMSWYCKALSSSGQADYKPAVETVLHNTENPKLRKYAKLSLNSFSSHAEKHKKIAPYISAGHDEKMVSIITNLKSDNLVYKIRACKKLLVASELEPATLDVVEQELLFGLTQQPMEEEADSYNVDPQSRTWMVPRSREMALGYGIIFEESMALMCRVLSNSGNPKYKEALQKVTYSSNSPKVRRYAKGAYKNL
jgi:hypothetical protein